MCGQVCACITVQQRTGVQRLIYKFAQDTSFFNVSQTHAHMRMRADILIHSASLANTACPNTHSSYPRSERKFLTPCLHIQRHVNTRHCIPGVMFWHKLALRRSRNAYRHNKLHIRRDYVGGKLLNILRYSKQWRRASWPAQP